MLAAPQPTERNRGCHPMVRTPARAPMVLLLLLVLTLSACGAEGPAGQTPQSEPVVTSSGGAAGGQLEPAPSTTPAAEDEAALDIGREDLVVPKTPDAPSISRPPPPSGSVHPSLAPLVELAVSDLASRLEVDRSSIEVDTAEFVVWPDASLGCPQPGMSYAQVTTDGSRIILVQGGVSYPYHTGGTVSVPFLCEQ